MASDNNKYNEPEFVEMGTNNKENEPDERRLYNRRIVDDRRGTTRFSDVLGRRSGVDRRLPVR